ncbi:PREDICTED: protein white-like [Priapulus caudatus]|uniref:Protein white-like n=1 Tax=Priapulus caudatus TaxID=37621 RepID=A0ABM1EM84_PRICU|nr:PREDICTED: protein white-like [Priapulus caudatus]
MQALLRMGDKFTHKQKVDRADKLLVELGLRKCADSVIGSPRRKGISGGEMKRLSFASEMITNLPLMFCDEPTTGLDSYMAQNVVSVLRDMASHGKTILCTIHQPSSEVFTMFDRLLLLAEGRTVFLGAREDALPFFSRLSRHCPEDYNPADYYIQQLAVVPGKESASREFIREAADVFDNSDCASEVRRAIAECGSHKQAIIKFENAMSSNPRYKVSWWQQLWILLQRTMLGQVRVPILIGVRIGRRLALALMIGLVYLNQELNQKGVQNLNGVMFNFAAELTFTTAFTILTTLPLEAILFFREHESGLYRVDAYCISQVVVQALIFVVETIVLVGIGYWMAGLSRTAESFFVALGIYILICQASAGIGFWVACASPSYTVAVSSFAPLNLPLFILSGFFMNIDSIPIYLSWMQWISWLRYGVEALFINQWRDISNITCENPPESAEMCYNDGQEVLDKYHFKEENLTFNIIMLCVLIVIYNVGGYVSLALRARHRMQSIGATGTDAIRQKLAADGTRSRTSTKNSLPAMDIIDRSEIRKWRSGTDRKEDKKEGAARVGMEAVQEANRWLTTTF